MPVVNYMLLEQMLLEEMSQPWQILQRGFLERKKVAGLKCDLDLSQTNQVPLMKH